MKYLPLIWAGLWRKRARTVLTLLSVITAFSLYGILDGITGAFDRAVDRYADASQLRVTNRVNISARLPLAYRSRIARVPGVKTVVPMSILPGYYRQRSDSLTALATDVRSLLANSDFIVTPAELDALQRTPNGAIVGPELLAKYGWHIGDRVPLESTLYRQKDGSSTWLFDIVGSYTLKEGAFPEKDDFLVNYDYFDRARGSANGMVTLYVVKVDDPLRAAAIGAAIDSLFRNSPDETLTLTDKAYIHAQIDRIGNVAFIVNSIVGAVLFTLLFLTGNTMIQSIRERIPELAVLRTYGFNKTAIAGLVAGESLLLCLSAAAVGLGIAAAVFPSVFEAMGVAALPLETSVIETGAVIAVALALLSALPPLWRTHRLQIVDALAART